ncbi:MerR family transcriptional regulator [Holzapfeliella floricola]|uniref:MerR family transcriptional regulator n=1 Tax=Holzapfeliella floricola TaxID=679249 RepID=UPI0007849BA9|nr:MerR family transcriptional regulator [Holzapfeliella floricola]
MSEKFDSIGEVSKKVGLPISTIRYYDKKELIPNIQKNTLGVRQFSEDNLEIIQMIEHLKQSGMSLKRVKQFVDWCIEVETSLENRRDTIYQQRDNIKKEIEQLQATLEVLDFKCRFYDEAVENSQSK